MKYISHITAVLALAGSLLLAGCIEDQGNYDYRNIDEVAIAGIAEQYEVLMGENITIVPELTSTLGGDEEDYTYEWVAAPYTDMALKTIIPIADTRELRDFRINLPADFYLVWYNVTDKKTGVQYSRRFEMEVKTAIYEGFLVMNDIDGAMRLDMLSYRNGTFHQIEDVLATAGCELPPQQGPMKVVCFFDGAFSPGDYAIYLLTQSGATRIHAETFAYDERYGLKYHFLSPSMCPEDFVAEDIVPGPCITLYSKGDLYLYERTMQQFWSFKANTTDGVNFFRASPWISASQGGVGTIVAFDEKSKSFLQASTQNYQNFNKMSGVFADTGKELLYLYSPASAEHFAVLKNPSNNDCQLLSFTVSYQTGVGTEKYNARIEVPGIHQASHFAVGGEWASRYLFYVIDNKVYQYNYNSKTSKPMAAVNPSGDQITYIGFKGYLLNTAYRDLSYKLIVCTYNPTTKQGKMSLYNVPGLDGDLTEYMSWSGFGKIVSLDYRTR